MADKANQQAASKSSEDGDPFYHQLLDRLPTAVYTCDIDGYLTFYNQAALTLWGVEPKIGTTKWCGSWKIHHRDGSIIPMDEWPMARAIKQRRIVSGEEIIVERPDGSLIHVLPHPRFIKDSAGSILGAINMLEDITLLKNTEQRLSESVILQSEAMNDGLQLEKLITERTKELELTKKELAFQNNENGIRAAELIIANKELVFQNEEKSKRAAELVIAIGELVIQNEEKESRSIELNVVNRELTIQINRVKELVLANGELAFQNGENGKRTAKMILANDELTLQQSEKGKRQAELIIANAQLAFQNGENEKRAAELTIVNGELAFQNSEKGKRALELIIANRKLVFQNVEKEKRAAELVIANGELAFQNEEKRKRASELVIANEELVYQNKEKEKRAAELVIANEELAFQNEEKEKRAAELLLVNAELEAFSYVSSHDLQEPLRKIQNLSSKILEIEMNTLSLKGKEYLGRMQSVASRMRLLIDDLLTFSRLNLAERKFEDTDLNKIVAEVINELKEIIEEKQVTIEATQLCTVKIIPFQFRQIMYNLISNALKFSRPDIPPHIIIKSAIGKGIEFNEARLLPEKNYCHVSISDNGIGFDGKDKDRIFEVFQRLHGKNQYAGSGIGLAIVKKVVDNHNGIINATGILDKGATFNIYFPVS